MQDTDLFLSLGLNLIAYTLLSWRYQHSWNSLCVVLVPSCDLYFFAVWYYHTQYFMASKSSRDEYLSESQWHLISVWSYKLMFFATRQSKASTAGAIWWSGAKSCTASWGQKKTWRTIRSGCPLQGEGICTSLDVTGGCIFHRVRVHAYVGRSSSLWACHGSFSLTFPVCTNKQLQTDEADDTANSLKFTPVHCKMQHAAIWTGGNQIWPGNIFSRNKNISEKWKGKNMDELGVTIHKDGTLFVLSCCL